MRALILGIGLALACGRAPNADGSSGLIATGVAVELTASRPNAIADGTDTILLTARVTRSSAAVASRPVSFAASSGLMVFPANADTDATGKATATVRSSAAGMFTVTATADDASSSVDLRFIEMPAAAIRFASLPTSVVVGESFNVGVAIEDGAGHPADPPSAVALSVLAHPSGVTLTVTTTTAARGAANFIATLDRDAIGISLVATAGTLTVRSAPIDVRGTRDQADWQPVGTEGAMSRLLLASPLDPLTLLALVPRDYNDLQPQARLLVTTDGARSWRQATTMGLPAATELMSAAWCADGSLYVDALETGVYRSRDNADTFQFMGGKSGFVYCDEGGSRPFLSQTSSPPDLLRWDGAGFSSIPGGPAGLISAAPDGVTVFGFSSPGDLFRSTDGGTTWSKMAATNCPVSLLAVSAATALSIACIGALDRTTDGGASWTRIFTEGIVSVTRAPKGILTLLDRRGGIRRSSDGGATWTDLIGTLPPQQWQGVVETAAGTWLASARAVYVLVAGSFRLATAGMGGLPARVFSDARTAFLYAAYDVGLYRFQGSGPWELVLPGQVQRVTFDPSSAGAMFASTWTEAFRSTDSGATWAKLAGAPGGAPFAAPDGRTWYAYSGGLWRSDDAGATWSQLWPWRVGRPEVFAMAFDGDALIFGSASTNAGKTFTGVFRSDDRGATYTATDIVWVPTVELLRVGPSLLVPSNVSRSDDSGHTFTALFPGHPRVTWIASDPADARVLVALEVQSYGAQPPAMYRSADGGSTWARCLSGLDRLQVSQIAFDPTDSSVLYAATNHGVYRSAHACPPK